tara:strand:+ start:1141 stop:1482 length:342 start_codon:yes stop_codon:yes gene_type:complete
MAVSRYRNNAIVTTNSEEYADVLTNRGVNSITHYSFESFKDLKVRDFLGIQIDTHTWKSSDRFFKLADKYYGDPTYWWVIASFNKTPLETDVELGQNILIPFPLESILSALGY